MKVLVVSPFSPYPLVFGGAIRLFHMIRMLAETSEVSLVMYRSWADEDPLPTLAQSCREVVVVDAKPPESPRAKALSVLRLHSNQYLVHRTAEMQQAVDDLVRSTEFDVVMLEMTPLGSLRLPSEPLLVLDLPNIEHELVERRAATASGVRKAALAWEALKVKREEIAFSKKFDLLLTTSDREQAIVSGWSHDARVETIPNTVDASRFSYRPRTETSGHHVVFIGTTHVDANRDGLWYFMNEIHPLLVAELPDLAVTIVGGDPPAEVRAYADRPNVTVTGYVKDVRDYMAAADAMIVPLRSGGGTRLKILEGLSFGLPTVSTSVGAEGLDLDHGQHIMIADAADDFAGAVKEVLTDGALRRRLSEQGRALVAERYDWPTVGRRLRDVIESSVAAKRAGA